MTENKKEWSEPELIVLVRSKPEEAVLTVCKYWLASTGSDNVFSSCYSITNPCSPACDYQMSS